ncbi:hypothetical protein AWJ20_1484 [Sugiyamaella lignohabitans]|uniref:Mediator of RNA polymerase II transcription subunit 19 n=1 Tax=Sugiyamaella lignohabitans TaxID=796027 RepID=A0A167DRF4_9ASCO|nr:uncharacterized protein AWJ20_1484 [Sugiyamaella lignohabitans]ANB13202.1 hypothetical protein AWJ20_1484 [Sugiyamaella lignohabitans]
MDNKEYPPLYLVSSEKVEPSKPSGNENLTELYGLTDLAASVARFDPVTGEKRKLRKSYKNQIADLWGKHIIPDASPHGEWSLLSLARQPRFEQSDPPRRPPTLAGLDQRSLEYALNMDPSPSTGIPGFDGALLAAPTGAAFSLPDSQQGNASGNDQATGSGGRGYTKGPFYQTHSRRNGSLNAASMTAESSNDDSTGISKRFKMKRRDVYEDGGVVKKRKKTAMS